MDRPKYRAVFISPHLDDAVFSCGGLIAQLTKEGPVLVINIFTRFLETVKIRSVVLGDERYFEEQLAAEYLGFESRNLGELDATFRHKPYGKLSNIFRPPVLADLDSVSVLRKKVFALLSTIDYQELYIPLGIGWHVDHVLTFIIFEPWRNQKNVIYYEEIPYALVRHSVSYRLNDIATFAFDNSDYSLRPTNEVNAWLQATTSYSRTAIMKNLRPWWIRLFAVPVVAIYFFRLMRFHFRNRRTHSNLPLESNVISISEFLDRKVKAMSCYQSQFREFFASEADAISSIQAYSKLIRADDGAVERYWKLKAT